jgi:hypothetical protein
MGYHLEIFFLFWDMTLRQWVIDSRRFEVSAVSSFLPVDRSYVLEPAIATLLREPQNLLIYTGLEFTGYVKASHI